MVSWWKTWGWTLHIPQTRTSHWRIHTSAGGRRLKTSPQIKHLPQRMKKGKPQLSKLQSQPIAAQPTWPVQQALRMVCRWSRRLVYHLKFRCCSVRGMNTTQGHKEGSVEWKYHLDAPPKLGREGGKDNFSGRKDRKNRFEVITQTSSGAISARKL